MSTCICVSGMCTLFSFFPLSLVGKESFCFVKQTCKRACVHTCYLLLLLTCFVTFSYNCNLFKHIFSFCFPEQFCSFTCYIDGMFQSKFPFKNNKVLSWKYLHYCIIVVIIINGKSEDYGKVVFTNLNPHCILWCTERH